MFCFIYIHFLAANSFRNMLMSDSRQFEAIQQRFPDLASAIQQGDTCL
jgi:hypothetical protein